MFSRLFTTKRSNPLFDLCSRLNIQVVLKSVDRLASESETKKATILSYLIMMAAAELVRDLILGEGEARENSPELFRNTNLDVITAEALVWVETVLFRMWGEHARRDDEVLYLVGHGTFPRSLDLIDVVIKAQTGVDFKHRSLEGRSRYIAAYREGMLTCVGTFAHRVMESVGSTSLADKPQRQEAPFLGLEVTMLGLPASAFYASMLPIYYKMFTDILRERPDEFL